MKKISYRFLIITFLVIVVFFLHFGSGTMTDGGMNGKTNEYGWMGSWLWFFTLATIAFGFALGWLHFKKKI